MANLGRIAIVPQGAYNEFRAYKKLDIITFNGSSYIALNDTIAGESPITTASKWMLSAMKGERGADGVGGGDGSFDGGNATSIDLVTEVLDGGDAYN